MNRRSGVRQDASANPFQSAETSDAGGSGRWPDEPRLTIDAASVTGFRGLVDTDAIAGGDEIATPGFVRTVSHMRRDFQRLNEVIIRI